MRLSAWLRPLLLVMALEMRLTRGLADVAAMTATFAGLAILIAVALATFE